MRFMKNRIVQIILLFGIFSLLNQTVLYSQVSKKISGTVVDTKGETLMGVSILFKGTSTGTITDINGNFSLSITNDNQELQFSYIGFETKIVPANAKSFRIVLSENNKKLEEVVVVGYGAQRKKDLTGSVSVIKSDAINALPVPSISDAMQGRAAGVQVISSGVPGSDATFRIRGVGTINNANPLIVIDGIPMAGGLNQLNMADVESIQVLKDASATAIYGSRGANGVVIVTTKRGTSKNDQGHLNFAASYGMQQATHMVKMLNATEFATMHNEMLSNAGLTPNPAFYDPASFGEGTDWLGALFRLAPMQNYSLSYSGGSEKSNYYISGNYLKQEGIVLNTGFEKMTFQFNLDSKLTNWLKLGNNVTLNHDNKNSGAYNIQNTMLSLPTQPVLRENGNYSGPVSLPIYDGDILNPIGAAKTVDNLTSGYNLLGSTYAEVAFFKELKFKTNMGIQANFWDSRTWAPKYAWDKKVETQSYLSQQYNKNITWLWDNTLSYDKVANKHRIGVMVGTSAQENRYNYINASVKNFVSDLTQQMDNGIDQPTNGGNTSSWALFSLMGRVNYGFADKYLFTATVRRDGSSRFGEGNKYGTFPSASFAWRVSEEPFLKNVSFINDLKLKMGYGITGNQEIGNYAFASSLNTYVYNFNNTLVSSVVPSVMPNPYVQWEQQKQTNIGFESSLANQRIDLTVEAYLKQTDKMLVPMVVPVSTGYSDIYVPSINAGEMENRGVEITMNTKNLTGKFKWNTEFNVSFNQNKVVSINDTVPMSAGSIGLNYNLALIKAGLPINEFYGFKTDGIFQNQQPVDNHATQVPGNDLFNRTSPGDIRFMDLNNDGVINDKDRTYLGSPNPTVIFAMNNTFSFKGVDLSIFMQGITGNKIINANRFWSEAMSVAQNQTAETLSRWNGEGTSSSMPRAIFNDPNKNNRPSDRFVENGAYLRIKNVTLGYTLPANVAKKMRLSSARLYFSGQNLFTFTQYKGFDPEVSSNGIDNNVYPVTRTMTVGINLGI